MSPRMAAFFQRPWLLIPGTALLLIAALLPHSAAGAVVFIVGLGLILAQIPISIWARRIERHDSSDSS